MPQTTQGNRRDGGAEAAQTEQDDTPQRSFDEMSDRWRPSHSMPRVATPPAAGPSGSPVSGRLRL